MYAVNLICIFTAFLGLTWADKAPSLRLLGSTYEWCSQINATFDRTAQFSRSFNPSIRSRLSEAGFARPQTLVFWYWHSTKALKSRSGCVETFIVACMAWALAVCAALAPFVEEAKAEWTIGLEKSRQWWLEAQTVSL